MEKDFTEEDFTIIDGYTLDDLSEESGVSPRTIRFYTTEGILPSPSRIGRTATYSIDHLNRLVLIRWLIHKGNSLSEIRKTIGNLDADKLQLLYDEAIEDWHMERKRNFAIRSTIKKVSPNLPIDDILASPADKSKSVKVSQEASVSAFIDRGGWRRYEIVPGVELHISDLAEREESELLDLMRRAASIYSEKRGGRRITRRKHGEKEESYGNLIDISELED